MNLKFFADRWRYFIWGFAFKIVKLITSNIIHCYFTWIEQIFFRKYYNILQVWSKKKQKKKPTLKRLELDLPVRILLSKRLTYQLMSGLGMPNALHSSSMLVPSTILIDLVDEDVEEWWRSFWVFKWCILLWLLWWLLWWLWCKWLACLLTKLLVDVPAVAVLV